MQISSSSLNMTHERPISRDRALPVVDLKEAANIERRISQKVTSKFVTENLSKILSFQPYTADSYKRSVERLEAEITRIKKLRSKEQEAYLVDGELIFGADEEDQPPPPRNPDLVEGNVLRNDYSSVPSRLFGKPLEEIDRGITDKTFVVIAKRYHKKVIFRFSATHAFFILPPWNIVRKAALYIATHQLFDMFIILTILINCVFLAWPTLAVAESAEYVFLSIYTAETIIKMLARGFFLNKYTYLRDPWHWLDFIVIVIAFASIVIQFISSKSVGNMQGLRTFRVLRALKTVSIIPGLKTLVNALLRAFKMLFEVIVLILFWLMVFALFALQLYMGTLQHRCVKLISNDTPINSTSFDQFFTTWIYNTDNWQMNEDEDDFQLCGNASGAGQCDDNHVCVADLGHNPNYNITNFDNFGWSMLNCFQLFTLDFWEDTYNKVIRSSGPWNVLFFLAIIFFGAFYLLNLMLAVVAMSYEQEAIRTGKEKERDRLADLKKKQQALYSAASMSKVKKKTNPKDRHQAAARTTALPAETADPGTNNLPTAHCQILQTSQESTSTDRKHLVKADCHESGYSTGGNPEKEGEITTVAFLEESDSKKVVQVDPEKLGKLDNHASFARGKNECSENTAISTMSYHEANISSYKNAIVSSFKEGDKSKNAIEVADRVVSYSDEIQFSGETSARLPVVPACIPKCTTQGREYVVITEEAESEELKGKLVDRNCACCRQRCMCFETWLLIQNLLHTLVSDPLFDLFITCCIVLNTVFLASEHHGMSKELEMVLSLGNYVFSSVFILEAIIKIIAMNKFYFFNGWNVFDLVIVVASIVDMGVENVKGLSVLRTFRLLRVVKLAHSWVTMKILLTIIISTLGAMSYLTIILFLIIYIFAVMGLQLFREHYERFDFKGTEAERWHFKDFFHSFMMIFRVLCGEWIEPLWQCMRAANNLCMIVFLPALIFGNFIVLNLFLALLINAFANDTFDKHKGEARESHKMSQAMRRLKLIFCCCCPFLKKNAIKPSNGNRSKRRHQEMAPAPYPKEEEKEEKKKVERETQKQSQGAFKAQTHENSKSATTLTPSVSTGRAATTSPTAAATTSAVAAATTSTAAAAATISAAAAATISAVKAVASSDTDGYSGVLKAQSSISANAVDAVKTSRKPEFSLYSNTKSSLEDSLASAVDGTKEVSILSDEPVVNKKMLKRHTKGEVEEVVVEKEHDVEFRDSAKELKKGGREKDEKMEKEKDEKEEKGEKMAAKNGKDQILEEPMELTSCCPSWFRKRVKCNEKFNKGAFGQTWYQLRKCMTVLVDHHAFESLVLFVILASSLSLVFEDVNLPLKPNLQRILNILNIAFCILFSIEMAMKWLAYGLTRYFTKFWTVLDFVIVLISIVSLLGDTLGVSNLTAFRSLRTLRALRPLRAISRWDGMRIVVNSLVRAIPSIFNVLLVGMMFWLIFSIMGVQFFKGRFYKCVNIVTAEQLDYKIFPNKSVCQSSGQRWVNSHIHFDNSLAGFLALFQVATFEGWMEVMKDATDVTEIDHQPQFEANIYAYLYFIVFIVFGSFFILNLFISVIIDNFNELKKKMDDERDYLEAYEGGYLDALLTENQRHYFSMLKKLANKKPQKTIRRPKNRVQRVFYNVAISFKFDLVVVILIMLNLIIMAMEHYHQPETISHTLSVLNIIFTSIFILEATIKIIGLRWYYFRVPWNIFDFLIVLLSLIDIILGDMMNSLVIRPTLMRVVRVFRIGRLLRLIKAASGIRRLLFALVISLPAIFNIGALLFLIMFIYAIIGMSSFSDVKPNGILNDINNFHTFGSTFLLLIRLATSAGWNDVLDSLLISEPDCNSTHKTLPDESIMESSFGDCGLPWLAIPYMITYIIVVFLIVVNMYIAIILENFNQTHQQEERGISDDDFDMFYVVWEKFDPHATQFIKYEQLSNFVAALHDPLKIEKPNEITLVSFNLPIMDGDRIHCLDILMALIKNCLRDVEETEELAKIRELMQIKFASVFPLRSKLSVKSTTLKRKKEDVAAKTLQRAWRKHKTKQALKNITELALKQTSQNRESTCKEKCVDTGVRGLRWRIGRALSGFFRGDSSLIPSRASSLVPSHTSLVHLQDPSLSCSCVHVCSHRSTHHETELQPISNQRKMVLPTINLYSKEPKRDSKL